MHPRSLTFLVLAFCAAVVGCSNSDRGVTGSRGDDQVLDGRGTVQLFGPDGHCASINVDGGGSLEPTNLPAGVQEQGLRVRFRVKIIPRAISTCQVGLIVEILRIEPI